MCKYIFKNTKKLAKYVENKSYKLYVHKYILKYFKYIFGHFFVYIEIYLKYKIYKKIKKKFMGVNLLLFQTSSLSVSIIYYSSKVWGQ